MRGLCGGGCPVGQFTIAGNPEVPARIKRYTEDIACIIGKTVIEELIWSLAKQKGRDIEEQKKR